MTAWGKTWDEFREGLRQRKQLVWADILASEPPGRPAGRRPRDPEQEALLLELDRERIARREWLVRSRREPVDPGPEGPDLDRPETGS